MLAYDLLALASGLLEVAAWNSDLTARALDQAGRLQRVSAQRQRASLRPEHQPAREPIAPVRSMSASAQKITAPASAASPIPITCEEGLPIGRRGASGGGGKLPAKQRDDHDTIVESGAAPGRGGGVDLEREPRLRAGWRRGHPSGHDNIHQIDDAHRRRQWRQQRQNEPVENKSVSLPPLRDGASAGHHARRR